MIHSFHHHVPDSLKNEQKEIERACNDSIDTFNKKCIEENIRLRLEKTKAIMSRKWNYSIKEIRDGWRILYKCTDEKIDDEYNELWSYPFKIINGVLFYSEHAYRDRYYIPANNVIPQGLFDESTLETINKDW